MTRMLPSRCSPDLKSCGERRVFSALRDDPGTEVWVCLHSLGLARHVRKRYGEIDFVVLVPDGGLFCLEVKGGRVRCLDGMWEYTDRYGKSITRFISPFMQARQGMFSLQHMVRQALGAQHRLARVVYGYGVVFPDVLWEHTDPEHEPWQVYHRGSRTPISTFVRGLAEKCPDVLHGGLRPSPADVAEMAAFLRPSFDYAEGVGMRMEGAERELVALTEEQYAILDALEDNDRLLIEGAAGTGKTLLALEYARRFGTRSRVLLLCFNRLLGRWMSSRLQNDRLHIVADSFHRFADGLIASSSRAAEFAALRAQIAELDSARLFAEEYPAFLLEALGEGVQEPYDVLIVDEGQDLIRPDYLDVFDQLLSGG